MTPMPGARIPHMGWNTLRATGDAEPLLEGIDDGATAYFVHGYAAPVSFDSVAIAAHGEPFCAVVRSRLYCGVQFHPERSGEIGRASCRDTGGIRCRSLGSPSHKKK